MSTTKSQQAGERTQHTPGPWSVRTPVDFGENKLVGKITTVGIPGSSEVYRTLGCSQEQCKVDANLISAAPELLDALDGMLAFIDQYATLTDCNGKNLEEDFSGFRKAAMKAIRKANGAGQ